MMMNYKKLIITIVFLMIVFFCIWQNNAISIREIDYSNPKIPSAFQGYRIVHISDLHNKSFGKNQEALLKKIKKAGPDIIVITGDLIDRRRYDLDKAMVFINGAGEIAPLYYVSGNHEAWSGEYEDIKSQLEASGVQVLDNQKLELIKDDQTIEILGLSDPAFLTANYIDKTNLSLLKEALTKMVNNEGFQILLSHRPELFNIYVDYNMDLIFSGHAHGGQVRLPFIGGLVAPNQGLLPAYTSGPYVNKESTLIVSRGLGNSIIPLRIFNRPEIVVLSFK